ncbi:MFS transporter [Uliginosibacterium sp. H1]|uniref:MFS transporter n=1 Tax=Uliginosibacterium sp. H1 TaxID=3114757 RepID=UPI002E17F0BD|nr:MFS transporter [Uliginosibacterium sp. H1]
MYGGIAVDALSIQVYAFVLPVLMALWGLSHAQGGMLATAVLVGSALGGWSAGYFADRFGRVRVMKLTVLWFAAASCLCGLASNFEQLFAARVLQGIGLGGELAVCAVFLGEVASARSRGRLVGLAQSGWSLGWAIAAAASSVMLSLLPHEQAWRLLFFVGLLPAAAIYLLRGRLVEPAMFRAPQTKLRWTAIFSGRNLAATMKGTVLAIGVHGGYWGIATWWPSVLLAERGLTLVGSLPYLAALIAGSFLGYVAGACLGDRAGRRITLGLFAFSGIVLVLVYAQLPLASMSFLLLSLPLGFVTTGMYGIIGSTLAELFPTEARGAGHGFCYNCGRGLAGFSPAVIGWAATTFGVTNAIALFAVVAYGMVIAAALLLSETKGKDLRTLHP